jgi:superfamily II DNA or RNA helicase
MEIDEKRWARQKESIKKWWGKQMGTIEAATGFGKTFVACKIAEFIQDKREGATVIVVVPTLQLQSQWEDELNRFGVKNYKVFVINSISKADHVLRCGLLILDEIHMYAAPTFRKVFDSVKFTWGLGLTATITRPDGLDYILRQRLPVIDTISQTEAKKNGWISNYREYNLPVYLTPRDRAELDSYTKQFNYWFSKFEYDFNLAMSCAKMENARSYAQHCGLGTDEVLRNAVQFARFMRLRKDFLYKTEHKLLMAKKLIEKFKLKTITFSQSTEFASELHKSLGDRSVLYHSSLPTELRVVKGKKTKFGSTKLRKEALLKFKDNRYKTDVINTAKALDQGFDVQDIELGIITSRTKNPIQHVQRTGRIARNFTYKDGTAKKGAIINLYVPDSQDEKWLRACQDNPDVVWVDSLEDIKI